MKKITNAEVIRLMDNKSLAMVLASMYAGMEGSNKVHSEEKIKKFIDKIYEWLEKESDTQIKNLSEIDIREAVAKRTRVKVKVDHDTKRYSCPSCGQEDEILCGDCFCVKCGQALAWDL